MNKGSDDFLSQCHPDPFFRTAAAKLNASDVDFLPAYRDIAASAATGAPRRAAGVLLPILRRPPRGDDPAQKEQLFFQLIKRSALVSQPGDLSCPGGMLHPRLDRFLSLLLRHGPVRTFCGPGGRWTDPAGEALRRTIALFFATALREAWEEIRLSPFHVRLLGPLPTQSLRLFRRTIFPLAGLITRPWTPKPNAEVDRIVEVPLAAFFDPAQFACLRLAAADPPGPANGVFLEYPCLVLPGPEGSEEILWGATFRIIVQFLEIVMDYRLPEWRGCRPVERRLRPDYLTGRSRA
jgi:8-oxo-dGTP pyrophosphatase MutT (NUDIX family)